MVKDLDSVIPINANMAPLWSEAESAPAIQQQRPLMHKISYPPRVTMNGLLLAALCAILLIFMGYIPLSFPSPLNLATQEALLMDYTFQLPLALFIGGLLGPFMGTASILIFLGVGLFAYPVFANGGGLAYLVQPGFGYLVGMMIGAYLVGKSFHRAFQKNRSFSRSWKLFTLAVFGCMTVHLIGLSYLALLTVLTYLPWSEFPGWVMRLTVEPIAYDLAAAFIFLCMVRQIRLCLWVVLY